MYLFSILTVSTEVKYFSFRYIRKIGAFSCPQINATSMARVYYWSDLFLRVCVSPSHQIMHLNNSSFILKIKKNLDRDENLFNE